jgi:hypothetical protein
MLRQNCLMACSGSGINLCECSRELVLIPGQRPESETHLDDWTTMFARQWGHGPSDHADDDLNLGCEHRQTSPDARRREEHVDVLDDGVARQEMLLGRCNEGLDHLERRRVDLGLTVAADHLAQLVFKIEKPASRFLGLHGSARYNATGAAEPWNARARSA